MSRAESPRTGRLAASWRLARATVHAVRGWLTIRWRFPELDETGRAREVERWSRGLLARLGITLDVRGAPAAGPVLLVANHVSWLDIIAMHAAGHCRFVSKAEVRAWPVIGTLATGGGTLYIERESRRDALRVVHRMAERLVAGDIVAIFPEGTTSDGGDVMPFHANLLQAALSAAAPVQPVGLRFTDEMNGGPSTDAAYIGDDTLLASMWRIARSGGIRAEVRYGDPQTADGRSRREWAEALREAVVDLRGPVFPHTVML